jgi:hypothetical protein
MSLLRPGGANYIGVRDLAAATAWYMEKLGLRKIEVEMDEPEGCIALGFVKNECAITLGPPGKSTGELAPAVRVEPEEGQRIPDLSRRGYGRDSAGPARYPLFRDAGFGRERS